MDSVLKHKWVGVNLKEVHEYAKLNNLKLAREKSGMIVGYKQGGKEVVFRYDPENVDLYSDHTILELKRGKVK
jgi:hypothetical protein